jgi:type I restriction enzyme M protein
MSANLTPEERARVLIDEQLTQAGWVVQDRKESERFKSFTYEELVARDKANLDLIWLKDDSLEDAANLPAPEVIAREIMENLESALTEFSSIVEALEAGKSE